jgi:hypothetical protein
MTKLAKLRHRKTTANTPDFKIFSINSEDLTKEAKEEAA